MARVYIVEEHLTSEATWVDRRKVGAPVNVYLVTGEPTDGFYCREHLNDSKTKFIQIIERTDYETAKNAVEKLQSLLTSLGIDVGVDSFVDD